MFRLSLVQRFGGVLPVLLLSGVAATETVIELVEPKNSKAYELRSERWLDSGSTVYFYRYRDLESETITPDVYCDRVRIATIADGSYVIANVDPGHHVFRTKAKQSIIEMDLVDGQTYYIQVFVSSPTLSAQGRLRVTDSVPDMGDLWPALPDPELGSIGVTVKASWKATNVYFVYLEDDKDAWTAEFVIRSNYRKKKQVYLLNAKPGRYVAVAASFGGEGSSFGERWVSGGPEPEVSEAFFSMETILLTEVTVGPGQMVFMGDFLVDLEISSADEVQAHYDRLISPAVSPDVAVEYGFFDMLFDSLVAGAFDKHGIHVDRALPAVEEWLIAPTPHWRTYMAKLNSVAKDAKSEKAFWGLARDKVFRKAPAWQRQVQRQLDALGEGEQ
jgi:hypothetical protein